MGMKRKTVFGESGQVVKVFLSFSRSICAQAINSHSDDQPEKTEIYSTPAEHFGI